MTKCSVAVFMACLLVACATSPEAQVPSVDEKPAKEKASNAAPNTVSKEPSYAEATALESWLHFVGRIETLGALELASERDRVLIEHRQQPSDGSRLALGFLLSRPQVLVHDVDKSRALLAEIDASGAYAPIRDLLLRELATIDEVAALKVEIAHLRSQLDALRAIETDLTENQKEIEEVRQ